jgi:YidC/Oxa1 family membrane protein insertase
MDAQKTRIFLIIGLFLIGFTLYGTWQQEHPPISSVEESVTTVNETAVPILSQPIKGSGEQLDIVAPQTQTSRPITVETDLAKYKIDLNGGDLIRAELKQYPESEKQPNKGFLLFDQTDARNYVAQSYLISDASPSPDAYSGNRAQFQASSESFILVDGQKELAVALTWQANPNLKFIKTYRFHEGQYLIDVEYLIENTSPDLWQGKVFYQLKRQFNEKKSGFMGVQMYQGGAYYTAEKPFTKYSFDKMKKQPLNEEVQGGWVAMLEHYFLSTWIPDPANPQHFYSKVENNNVYKIGTYREVKVPQHSVEEIKSRIYVGPEDTDVLKEISPGLNLTIDYGILWPISQLLFWLLKNIHEFVGNWGAAIILVTVVIKLVFYKLSAASYRSMGHMRRVQPQIQALKERCGEDKQQFSQSMMALYKKEKINPLGGCLPILLQIPVFIALYYVLLESVELRQSPFIFWITDLATKDPYYILPLLMGATMFLQQRLSPAPPDPMQAKMMMFMPVVFTFLFMSFPSGLVLYWTVNNMLSILQQWYITRGLEKEGLKRA